MTTKTIETNCFGITITFNENDRENASICSDIKDAHDANSMAYNFAVDALESMILGHFTSGIDITTPSYLCGIELAIEALSNHEPQCNYDNLMDALNDADSVSIDDSSIRHFNIMKLEDLDDDDVFLDAGEFQFSLAEVKNASKSGTTWFLSHDDEEYQLTCEKVIGF